MADLIDNAGPATYLIYIVVPYINKGVTVKKPAVLNWYEYDLRMIKGLEAIFEDKVKEACFVTMRLGPKWANKLNPGERVAISISNNPRKPQIIGYAYVSSVEKIQLMQVVEIDFKRNIGAKTYEQTMLDMSRVYGEEVHALSIVSILRFVGRA